MMAGSDSIATMEKTNIKPNIQTPQTFSGLVVSDKMKNTVSVEVKRFVQHPKYGKYQVRKVKIMADDPGNTKKIGDKVTIKACRPISKRKAFRIIA